MQTLVSEAAEVRIVKVDVPENVAKRRDDLMASGLCIGCEQPTGDKQVRKGLCPACYQAALRALKSRKTTKTNLVRNGKMLDGAKRGRPSNNKFTKELAEL